METCYVVLTFKSGDEILWCDHLSETSSAVLLHGTICFLMFNEMKFRILYEFLFLALLRVKGLNNSPCLCQRVQILPPHLFECDNQYRNE